jgi:MFS transporter, CP family, cyanate transporter
VGVSGVGMGAASAIVPGIIAARLPEARGIATGIYATSFALGVGVAAWLALPSADLLHGWRGSLGIWGALALVAAGIWAVNLRPSGQAPTPLAAVRPATLPWRSPVARRIAAYTAAQMTVGFCAVAAIVPQYVDLGLTASRATNLFVMFQLAQVVAMLGISRVIDISTDRRPLIVTCALCSAAGLVLLLTLPVAAALPAAVLFGTGVGGGSTLGLTLIGDVSAHAQESARLGSMVFGLSFAAGAVGPVTFGALHDLTGSFEPGFVGLLLLVLAVAATARAFAPEAELEPDPP